MPPRDLIERTRLFALAVRAFCRKAPKSDESQEAIKQLRKSANSVRSNYRAARKGRSRGEFESKLHIASKRPTNVSIGWSISETRSFITTPRSFKKQKKLLPFSRLPFEQRRRTALV
jgi:four helix bundle protein